MSSLASRGTVMPGSYQFKIKSRKRMAAMSEVLHWLRHHGVRPESVPVDSRVEIGGGMVSVEVRLERDGKAFLQHVAEHPTTLDGHEDHTPCKLARGRLTVELQTDITLPASLELIRDEDTPREGIVT
jgi:hypothetical protein